MLCVAGHTLAAVVLAGCEGRDLHDVSASRPIEARVVAARSLFEEGVTAGADLFQVRSVRPRDLHFPVQALLDTLDRQRRSLVLAQWSDASEAPSSWPDLRPGSGVALHALSPLQRRQVLRLLRESLAPEGVARVRALAPTAFDDDIDPGTDLGDEARDAVRFRVMGVPHAEGRWGWRLSSARFIVECEIGPDLVTVSQAVLRR